MDWNHLVNLLDKVAWPLVVVLVFVALRPKLSALIDRAREVEAPAMRIKLDPNQVERIVAEGKDAPADVVARRIIANAVVDTRELRILRALVGENDDRRIYAYPNAHYRPALESLLGKRLIERRDQRYVLTGRGVDAVSDHLDPILAKRRGHQDRP